MNKETLKRMKAGLLALMITGNLTLTGCNKNTEEQQNETNTEENNSNKVVVIFIEGKAIIFDEKDGFDFYDSKYGYILIREEKFPQTTIMSIDETQRILTYNYENAYTIASMIVGEENILYGNYEKTENNDYKLVLEKTR